MAEMSAMLKRNDCLSNKEDCTRYMVVSAGKPVPGDLCPNSVEAARALLPQG